MLPKRLRKLPFAYLQKAEQGYEEFEGYMRDLLEREKKLGERSDGKNLLAAMVKHSALEKEGGLNDREIIGNTFIFLIAGHETTYFRFVLALITEHTPYSMHSLRWRYTQPSKKLSSAKFVRH